MLMSQSASGSSTTFVLPRESLAEGAHHGAASLSSKLLADLLFDGVQRVTDAVQAQRVEARLQSFCERGARAVIASNAAAVAATQ